MDGLDQLTQAQIEEWEERAAIMEFDGQMPREKAERLALDGLLIKYSHTTISKIDRSGHA